MAAGLVFGGCAGPDLGPIPSPPDRAHRPSGDVEITSCGIQFGMPAAGLRITNSTDVPRAYTIVVAVRRDGRRIADMRAGASDLAPGQTVRPTAFALAGEAEPSFSCALASVRRFPAR